MMNRREWFKAAGAMGVGARQCPRHCLRRTRRQRAAMQLSGRELKRLMLRQRGRPRCLPAPIANGAPSVSARRHHRIRRGRADCALQGVPGASEAGHRCDHRQDCRWRSVEVRQVPRGGAPLAGRPSARGHGRGGHCGMRLARQETRTFRCTNISGSTPPTAPVTTFSIGIDTPEITRAEDGGGGRDIRC